MVDYGTRKKERQRHPLFFPVLECIKQEPHLKYTKPDPVKSIQALAERAKASHGEKTHSPEKAPLPHKTFSFPLPFGDDTRAVSNLLARGPLFAAVKDREHFTQYVLIAEVDGVKIEFIGEQFNQDDHDTLLQLVKMAIHKPYGDDIEQSVNSVLQGIGRATHQEQRNQLFDQISRLVRGTIRTTTPERRYEGHLLDDASTPQDQRVLPQHRRHLAYRLNPKFAQFYASSAYTLFDLQDRAKLKGRGSELAKWLHLWVIGNVDQYPHKVETIRQKCGSRDKTLFSFRQKLRQALDLLKEAGIITSWQIAQKSDLVTIERTPSESQKKHITKNSEKSPKLKKS